MSRMVEVREGRASMGGKARADRWKASDAAGSAPTVATSRSKSRVAAVAPATATSAEGIFGCSLGRVSIAAAVPAANAAAPRLMSARRSLIAVRISKGFSPPGTASPSALGSWPVRIIRPMPVVKPEMTLHGTNLVTFPPRAIPVSSCKPPAAHVMIGSAAMPCVCTASPMSRMIALAGPVMARVVPPIMAPTKPAVAALTRPTSGGSPLATAMARDSGTAMQPTVRPAATSASMVVELNILRHSGTSDGRPRSRIIPPF
mmetsp:Transcript_8819/g.29097  ORF Transcript_8819/g.29097 Transcript_8819/m.29097 type:complete len:260 (-) Transcript_8819:214-993(-)